VKGALRMISMRLGGVISFLGAIVALAPIIYYITLPLDSPTRTFLSTPLLGLIPYIFCFTILGAVITGLGLFFFIKAARAAETPVAPRATTRVIMRMPAQVGQTAPPSRVVKLAKPKSRDEEIVREIEREIEAIVKSEETPAEVEEAEEMEEVEELAEEAPAIEVVTKGADMVCPHCGALNQLGSTKCAKCGKALFRRKKDEPTCPVCAAPLRLVKRISDELFVCGLCFSELRIPQEIQESLNLK